MTIAETKIGSHWHSPLRVCSRQDVEPLLPQKFISWETTTEVFVNKECGRSTYSIYLVFIELINYSPEIRTLFIFPLCWSTRSAHIAMFSRWLFIYTASLVSVFYWSTIQRVRLWVTKYNEITSIIYCWTVLCVPKNQMSLYTRIYLRSILYRHSCLFESPSNCISTFWSTEGCGCKMNIANPSWGRNVFVWNLQSVQPQSSDVLFYRYPVKESTRIFGWICLQGFKDQKHSTNVINVSYLK